MDTFFELLNAGDREAAVQLMAENAEMRIHVGDSAQTLRGVDRVGPAAGVSLRVPPTARLILRTSRAGHRSGPGS